MALLLFSFVVDPATKEAVFSGNVEPAVALQVLQDIVIADLVKKGQKETPKSKKKATKGPGGKE